MRKARFWLQRHLGTRLSTLIEPCPIGMRSPNLLIRSFSSGLVPLARVSTKGYASKRASGATRVMVVVAIGALTDRFIVRLAPLGSQPHRVVHALVAGDHSSTEAEQNALTALRLEIDLLRTGQHGFLLRIEEPRTAALRVEQGMISFPTEASGPWDVTVTFAGNFEDEVVGSPVRVRLRFSRYWPDEPPSVRVLGSLSFVLLDSNRSPPSMFFNYFRPRVSCGSLQLDDFLIHLWLFLLDPLGFLGLLGDRVSVNVFERARILVNEARRSNQERVSVVSQYALAAKHPELFDLFMPVRAEWFDTDFWNMATSSSVSGKQWPTLLTEHIPGEVYSFRLFTDGFCDMLVEEILNFQRSGLPARRPNSMNNYGMVLSDIGLEPFVDKLQDLLQPLGHFLFPGLGSDWDEHHCFVVRYREGEDLGLDMHTDEADITFNACLGLEFSGSGLRFCGHLGEPDHRWHRASYQHKRGNCVVHPGRRRHGADDIVTGERLNLILWNLSSTYRQSEEYRKQLYAREGGPPDPLCVSYTHDRDFGMFRVLPRGKEKYHVNPWCPPAGAEYEGFRPDARHEVPKVGHVDQTI